jgi:hypothetical protein
VSIIDEITMEVRHEGLTSHWGSEMDHWTVTLHRGDLSETFPYYMGLGHNGAEPTLHEVLSCLSSDASMVDEYGGDPDEWRVMFSEDTTIKELFASIAATIEQTSRFVALLGGWDVLYELGAEL